MPGRIPGVSSSMSHFILRTNSLGIQWGFFFMDLKLGAPRCGMILTFHSMIIPKLIHFTLGQYLYLYSLQLWRMILTYTFGMHVCVFLVSNLGVDAASWTVCAFNFSRLMLNRLLKWLLPDCTLSVVMRVPVAPHSPHNIVLSSVCMYNTQYIIVCIEYV